MNRPGDRLKAARLLQRRKEDGEPWSQDNMLDAIAATGWRPAYKNYLDTERGDVQPKPETWRKYVAFYAGFGVDLDTLELPSPDAEPSVPVMDVPTALFALSRAWEDDRAALIERMDQLDAMVKRLTREVRLAGGTPAPTTPRVLQDSAG